MISNPMAQLSVATQAADIKIEEADIALANTLDTMRATGASAGGATALANAALRSKRGVAASIEQQEKSNEDKRAAGEQRAQQQKISEQQRMQQADVAGKQFTYREQEIREMTELDRLQAQITGQAQAASQARQDQAQTGSSLITALGNVDFSKKTDTTSTSTVAPPPSSTPPPPSNYYGRFSDE